MFHGRCPDELTLAETYRVMLRFVADYRGRAGNDLFTLLFGCQPLEDGRPGDPASPSDWNKAIRAEFGCTTIVEFEWPTASENFRPDTFGRSFPFWAIPKERLSLEGNVASLNLRDSFALAADFMWRFDDQPIGYLDEFITRSSLGSDGRPTDHTYEDVWIKSLGELLDESPDALRRTIKFF